MKKLNKYTNKTLILTMGIITIIGLLWSCDKEKVDIFWNDDEAATLISVSPDAEFESFDVTIMGKYFSSKADNTVTFNGIEAEIISANLTEIVATVPDGATTGDIVVTSDGHVSAGLPFTVLQPIIATISSLSSTSGKVRDEIVITGTDFSTIPEENIVLFNGTPAVVTASTATTITTRVPAFCSSGPITVTRDLPSDGVAFTLIASSYFEQGIVQELDDVEEASSTGIIDGGSSDLELGEFDTTGDPDYGLQTIGLRFESVTIPAGSDILGAAIQFTCDATGAGPVQLTIYGENTGDSPIFEEDVQYTVTSRAKTSAYAVWNVLPWLNVGDSGFEQRTIDLYEIVQEIIDRGDWVAGNSMTFILEHSGPSIGVTDSENGREAEAGDDPDSAILKVIYE
jgi:hypothetical protein